MGDENTNSTMDDCKIISYDTLVTPASLTAEFQLSTIGQQTVKSARLAAEKIIDGSDDRLLVIVGPCSIHDVYIFNLD